MASKNTATASSIPNIFAPTAPVAPKQPAAKAAKVKPEVTIGEPLDKVVAYKIVIKTLESAQAVLESEVKETSLDAFVGRCVATHESPVSMLGQGDRSTASVQLRRNGSNRALSEDVVNALKFNSIPFTSNVAVPERFVFNPELNQAQLIAINALIMKDPEMQKLHAFTPIVIKQPEESINIVSDETIAGIAKLSDKATIAQLLKGCMTLALSQTKFDGEDEDQLAIAISILQGTGDLPSAEKVSKNKKSSKKVA